MLACLHVGWALAVVTSRAFRTRGPNHPAALLPLIDMANHSFDANCEVLPTQAGGVGLFSKRKVGGPKMAAWLAGGGVGGQAEGYMMWLACSMS